MRNFFTKDIVVLDVTSRLISAMVGVKKAQSVFCLKALSEKPCSGFEDGVWFDEEETAQIAYDVLQTACRDSQTKSKKLFVSVPGEFVTIVTKEVSIELDRQRKVIDADIDYLIQKGDTFDSKKYLTIVNSAIYYSVDTSDELYFDVRGMAAKNVTGCISYALCETHFCDMFDEIAEKLGLNDVRYVASNWAEGLTLFDEEQRENSLILVDIGYLSSTVSLIRGEGVIDMRAFSMGGAHISADIYEGLEVPFELAEKAKELVDLNLNYSENAILVGDSDYTIYALDACEIVKARMDVFADIIDQIISMLDEDSPSSLPVYLTGEGISSLRGTKKYLSELLGKNIEIVTSKLAGFDKPECSSKVSLLKVAETMSKINFGEIIKGITNGGTK